jgi:hypothetical protein
VAEYLINKSNIEEATIAVADHIDKVLADGGEAKVVVTKKSNGTWPMLKLWRAWMKQICDHLNANGRYMPLYIDANGIAQGKRPMTPEDCHHAYSHLALGSDENGNRLSWALSDGDNIADTGQRLRAMDKIWLWATGEGIPLINPQDSEYNKIQDKCDA